MLTTRSLVSLALLALSACGRAPTATSLAGFASAAFADRLDAAHATDRATTLDLHGSLADAASGSQAALAGWVVVALARDTGIAAVAEVDAAGLYTLRDVAREPQTLVLLSPDYVAKAVLALPSPVANTVRTHFVPRAATLPKLVAGNGVLRFTSLEGVEPTHDLASDADGDGIPDVVGSLADGNGIPDVVGSLADGNGIPDVVGSLANGNGIPDGVGSLANGDGIPDGVGSLAGAAAPAIASAPAPADPAHPSTAAPSFASTASTRAPAADPCWSSRVDLDLDGTPNVRDPDLDGDGVPNAFDADDDGDGILDALDDDANGDLIADAREACGDGKFTTGLASFAVTVERAADGTVALHFAARLAPGASAPRAVQIRGAASLLNDAVTLEPDAAGQPVPAAWNRLLAATAPGLYERRVLLAPGKAPRGHEALFAQLVRGDLANPRYTEFPWVSPPLALGPVTAQLDAATATVLLVGEPFGATQDFSWLVSTYDAAGRPVWTSAPAPGATRQRALPREALESAAGFAVTALSAEKLPGMPGHVTRGPLLALP